MKILHIEDNVLDAELISHSLHKEWPECEIEVVFTRPGCTAAMQRGGHDLILSDFRLVKFSGLEALELARELEPNTPFVYFSGSLQADLAAEAMTRGAAAFVPKDLPHELVSTLRQTLRTSRGGPTPKPWPSRPPQDPGAALAQARTAIVVTAADLTIGAWNRGAESLFGWKAEDVVGEKLSYVLNDTVAGGSLLEETDEWRGEVQVTSRYGKALTVDVHITLLRDENDEPNARVHVFADVTLVHSLRNQFFRAQRLECLGLLATGIAHDLNNVLTPLLLVPTLMRNLTSPLDHERFLRMIETNTTRGADLVRQITRFAGGGDHRDEPIALSILLNELVEFVKETFPPTIVFEKRIEPVLPVIHGDPTRLHQVLLNLCINARDAMPRGGKLILSAGRVTLSFPPQHGMGPTRPGPWLEISVQDSGVGIPPEMIDLIWEPFFSTKAGTGGTGLGLSTVRGIIQDYQGFITVESTPNVGTTFRIHLPCAEAEV